VKWGNSRGIRLPKPYLESLNLKDNDAVEILTDNNTIIIRKSKASQHKTLKQRVEEFYGKDFEAIIKDNLYNFEEEDWGHPVGSEVW